MKIIIGNYPKDVKKERKISIRIDEFDTWNLDSTLALIIVPLLKQLKKTQHGLPNECFSEEYQKLISSKEYYDENGKGPLSKKERKLYNDAKKKWAECLTKMIWAFEQINIDWRKKYYSGKHDIKFIKSKKHPNCNEMVKGPKDTFKIDHNGIKKHEEKIQEGIDLFAKYYQNLWD